jgi:flagellin-like hook-associated protein FlgL|tara:strand:- start:483 stop:632 length:150 start_codon:yes stop_codon:yes gene_type:complete
MNLTKSQEVHNILEQIREVVEKHAKTPQEYDSLMLDINELEEDIINILK